jgi:hypothetical protein
MRLAVPAEPPSGEWRVLSSPNRAGSSSGLATRFPSSQEPAPALASLTMSLDASASRVSS